MGCDQINKLQWFTETLSHTHTCTHDLYTEAVWWKFAAKDCGYAFTIICFRKGERRKFDSL